MGFNLAPSTSSNHISRINVSLNDTIIYTQVTDMFLTTSEGVQEYVLSNHRVEASLKIIRLDEPWPELQVQVSKQYEPYK